MDYKLTCVLTSAALMILLVTSATLLAKAEYEKYFLTQSNSALLNETENLRRALTTRFPEIDTTLPTLVLNVDVADAKVGEWTLVSITSSKMRDDCPAVTTRHIMDYHKTEHQIVEATRSENASVAAQKYVNIQFQIKVPETVAVGAAFYQSRSRYTCSDGSTFLITSPWAAFNIS